jgi:hypothetical protein
MKRTKIGQHGPSPIKIGIKFEPRDLWIGWYWDKQPGIMISYMLYIYWCIIPMFPISFIIRGPRKIMIGDPAAVGVARKEREGSYWRKND